MANIKTLYGSDKLREAYPKVNENFNAVNGEVNDLRGRVNNIITTPIDGEAAAQELTDARGEHSTLGERLDEFDSHMADFAKQSVSVYNAKGYGAKGDKVTDDTLSLKQILSIVKNAGGGILYFPEGTYIISDTLKIPPNTILIGANRATTIIKAKGDAVFPTYTPLEWSGMTEAYRYKSMITTDSVGSEMSEVVENIRIANITIDWNNCIGDGNSVAPLWIDCAEKVYIENVEVLNALDSELNNPDSRNQGSALLISFAKDCFCDNVILHEADYESLSVRYLSKNIHFRNSMIDTDKPFTYRSQSHLIQLARPTLAASELLSRFGEERSGPLFVYDCTLYPGSGVAHVGTSHRGAGFYVFNNYVKVKDTANMVWCFKTFDQAEHVVLKNNIVEFETGLREGYIPSVFALNDGAQYTKYFKIEDNIIRIKIPENHIIEQNNLRRAVIGSINDVNSYIGTIRNNKIIISNYYNQPFRVIGVAGDTINVSDNVIEFADNAEPIDTGGPIAVYVSDYTKGIITNNIVSGAFGVGIELQESSIINDNIINNNIFDGAVTTINKYNHEQNNYLIQNNFP